MFQTSVEGGDLFMASRNATVTERREAPGVKTLSPAACEKRNRPQKQ